MFLNGRIHKLGDSLKIPLVLVPMLRVTAVKLRGQTLQSPDRDGMFIALSEKRENMGKIGKKIYKEKFTIVKMIEQIDILYNKCF